MKDPGATYIATLSKMAELEGNSGLMANGARTWNRLTKRLQEARKELARTDEGRALVVRLLHEDRVTNRLWAASHALHWPDSTSQARSVLEQIASDPANGLNSLNAEMTLSEFHKGRLNPDW